MFRNPNGRLSDVMLHIISYNNLVLKKSILVTLTASNYFELSGFL